MASVLNVYKGQVYIGEYELNSEELTVIAGHGSKKANLNGANAVELARELLLYLIKIGSVQPELAGPILIKGDLRIFELTEFNSDGPKISSYLVSGPLGALKTYASYAEAEAYLNGLHIAQI